jgi:hypothetical protein
MSVNMMAAGLRASAWTVVPEASLMGAIMRRFLCSCQKRTPCLLDFAPMLEMSQLEVGE